MLRVKSGFLSQWQDKRRFITFSRAVFLLALVHHDISSQVQRNRGPEKRRRRRTSNVLPIYKEIASVARAFDAMFGRVPDGGAAKMGANGYERIDALLVANHPDSLLFLHAGADFPDLVILGLAGNELLRGFVENPGKEKPQRANRYAAAERSKAAPSQEAEEAPPGSLFRPPTRPLPLWP